MVTKSVFGQCPQGTVYAYKLENTSGVSVTVLTLGGIIQSICVPTKEGVKDVCLGYHTVEEYLAGTAYFGAIVGRNANRIAGAQFPLNDEIIHVLANNGPNQLHGGPVGFDRRLWNATSGDNSVTLQLLSPDGEGGFPGNVQVQVVYTLDDTGALTLSYTAVPDADTVINLTNHAYFNLGGTGSVLEHTLWIDGPQYTVAEGANIPTGELRSVANTPLDFTTPKTIGRVIQEIGIYDHNFCLEQKGVRKVAEAQNHLMTMEVETNMPGVQLYCANLVSGHQGKELYQGNCFFCQETQHYPDAVNHPNFPSPIVRAGETYSQTTVYRFLAK